MPYLIGIGVPLGLITVWWFVFRAAMKHPNNGNEFSEDNHPSPGPFA
jgi:hypothetical protein